MGRRHRRMSRRELRALAAVAALVLSAGAGHAVTAAPHHAAAVTTASSAPGNVALGQQMASGYGWGSGPQWTCLYDLWQRESGWDTLATYPSTTTPPSAPSSSITTAYGIPQALPAQKMAAAGPGWRTDAATQIQWGLGYVASTYSTPCGAWSHEVADGWY